jgi:hypothetical protein
VGFRVYSLECVSSYYSLFRIRPTGLLAIRINLELWILCAVVKNPSEGVQPCRKALSSQANTNTEETRTDIHASSVIRTHDPSV